ncbi:50S ribosomal protein L35 [Neisseriaceae bacterium PsAf]|nr:50S ribosomal protein L35 [Neisseriaceae bacterium PsAf]
MPKMKSKSSAKKRFKVLGNGKVKRASAFKRHILTKKSTKTKRQLRGTKLVHNNDKASISQMLPYSK